MLRCFTNCCLALACCCAYPAWVGAKQQAALQAMEPMAFSLGVDLAKLCWGWYEKTGTHYEGVGSLQSSKWLLSIEGGGGNIYREGSHQPANFSDVSGHYVKIGIGYNCLSPSLQPNQFFIGGRYARSRFNYNDNSLTVQCKHPGDKHCSQYSSKCTPGRYVFLGSNEAEWWELVVGGSVQLVKQLAIGSTFRYKFKQRLLHKRDTFPFEIPGFGFFVDNYAFGYSFYLLFTIPLQSRSSYWHKAAAQFNASST